VGRLRDWEDQRSWQEFHDTYGRLILRAARRAGLSEADAQEVVQETTLSAAKAMPRFEYNPAVCSFKGWLLHLTRCRIADHLRKQGRRVPTVAGENDETDRTGLLERQPDPGGFPATTEWDAEWEASLLEAALERVRTRAQPLHFQIFQLCALQHLSAREVARDLDVNVAQVYLAKHRVGALLKKEVAALKKRWA
jgi:RNA polymerase sigma-70 factor (ECF subfamily)